MIFVTLKGRVVSLNLNKLFNLNSMSIDKGTSFPVIVYTTVGFYPRLEARKIKFLVSIKILS